MVWRVASSHTGAGDASWLPAVVFVFVIQSKHVRDCLLISLLNKCVCTSCAAVHRRVCSLWTTTPRYVFTCDSSLIKGQRGLSVSSSYSASCVYYFLLMKKTTAGLWSVVPPTQLRRHVSHRSSFHFTNLVRIYFCWFGGSEGGQAERNGNSVWLMTWW